MRVAIGPLAVCLVVVGVAGALYGVQTDRWRPSPQLEHSLARLDHVPRAYGDWKGEDSPNDAETMDRAGIKGWIARVYRNPRTRDSVSVLLVCGRGGPISVHTPDICYAGAGFRQLGGVRSQEVEWSDGEKSSFRVARFVKPGQAALLEVYWAWSRDGRSWEAPESPRLSFARFPALYKLYVVREFLPGTREETTNPCRDFLRRSLPELRQALAPPE